MKHNSWLIFCSTRLRPDVEFFIPSWIKNGFDKTLNWYFCFDKSNAWITLLPPYPRKRLSWYGRFLFDALLRFQMDSKLWGPKGCFSWESDCRSYLKSHLRNKVRTIIDIELHSRFLENPPSHSTWATGRNHRNYSKPGTMHGNLWPSQDIFLSDLFYSESRSRIVK